METKEADRIVVSKPVASRPSSSIIIRPFSNLVAGAIKGSSPNMGPEMGTGPIKPKTVRFKPTINHVPTPVSSQGDAPKSDLKPTILYKPLAKVVSKTAASLLANMGNFEPSDRPVKPSPRPCSSGAQLSSNFHEHSRDLPATASGDCSSSLPVGGSRDLPPAASGDRPSYDGYNWRKYGQKQVKGSEYPRSYYKCTHPNCQVKKKVERSLDGQIAEIVYKGEHNHPKPLPPKQGLGTVQMTEPSMSSRVIERKEDSESKAEATNGIILKGSPAKDCAVDRGLPSAGSNLDGHSAEHKDGTMRMGMDPDEPRSKRRKTKNQQDGLEVNGDSPREPQVSVQGSADPEILDDGFRWRKYGQKVVKGNPYPRSVKSRPGFLLNRLGLCQPNNNLAGCEFINHSLGSGTLPGANSQFAPNCRNYYKCTGFECNVRKHVERSLDDPTVFITTYEGKHNHEMPPRSMNKPSSDLTPRTTAGKERMPA